MGKKLKSASASKVLNYPQKYLSEKAADHFGVEKGKDVDETSRNLVQKAADKLGIKDSTAANALKAVGAAGLSMVADPLNVVPGLGPAKRLLKLGRGVSKAKALNKAKLPTGARTKAAPGAVREAKLQALGDVMSKKPSNTAKLIQANDKLSQVEKGKRIARSPDIADKIKNMSPEDKEKFKKALLRNRRSEKKNQGE
jgi:hypothetical protein